MLKHALNLFFPNLCAGCGQPLATGQLAACTACRLQLPYTNFESFTNNPVAKTFWGRVELKHATALFYYQKNTLVQNMLHELKYKNNKHVAHVFGAEMGAPTFYKMFEGVSAIVPVPMHKSKRKIRRYNQSELIAKAMAAQTEIELETEMVKKINQTTSQTKKTRFERWINKQEDFLATTTLHKHIMLVDDVITTGATLESCVNAIRLKNPNILISVFTLAYTYR